MSIPYNITKDALTVVIDGKTHVVANNQVNFSIVRAALLAEDWNRVRNSMTPKNVFEAWSDGKFKYRDDKLFFEDTEVNGSIATRIVEMIRKGDNPTALLNFWTRLQNNPSYRSVTQLWSFLTNKNIPLTRTGFILAYKSVRRDYKDHHSGTLTNTVGTRLKMPRNQISDDPQVPCHEGLHVGALAYASDFVSGSRIIICKIDPADVVCVPYDSSQQKMRVCEYLVVGEHGGELPSTVLDDLDEVYIEELTQAEASQASGEPDLDEDEEDEKDEDEDEEAAEIEAEEAEHEEEVVVKPAKVTPKKAPKKAKATPKKKAEAKVVKAKATKPAKAIARTSHKYDKLTDTELLDIGIRELREYAAKSLHIAGVGHLPGGKMALVAKISEIRNKDG